MSCISWLVVSIGIIGYLCFSLLVARWIGFRFKKDEPPEEEEEF